MMKKNLKKNWYSENILYLVRGGGQPNPRKKIVSVGLFSTFRHSLGTTMPLPVS